MTNTRTRVAATVRDLAEERFPYVAFQSGPKETLRRALGYTDRRTMDDRWTGRRDYTTSELATLADLLGVDLATLLASAEPRDGALANAAPDSGTAEEK